MAIIDNFHQPEYTGENRCIPCTVVNVGIAAVLSAFAALVSTILGVGVFALSLGTIYFRGYLVPGTPAFTKRYLPERVLQWLDKDSIAPMNDETVEIDPEWVLLDAGAVEQCEEGTDLCLTPKFQQAWRKRIRTVRTQDLSEDRLADALGVSTMHDQFTVDQQDDAFVAHTDDAVIGQWNSQAAAIADVAAASELSERFPNWPDFAPAEIASVLMSLRIFIEQCPQCDGPVQVEQEVVESCCRSYDVVASSCQNCDNRLFEMEWVDADAGGAQEQPNQPSQVSA